MTLESQEAELRDVKGELANSLRNQSQAQVGMPAAPWLHAHARCQALLPSSGAQAHIAQLEGKLYWPILRMSAGSQVLSGTPGSDPR